MAFSACTTATSFARAIPSDLCTSSSASSTSPVVVVQPLLTWINATSRIVLFAAGLVLHDYQHQPRIFLFTAGLVSRDYPRQPPGMICVKMQTLLSHGIVEYGIYSYNTNSTNLYHLLLLCDHTNVKKLHAPAAVTTLHKVLPAACCRPRRDMDYYENKNKKLQRFVCDTWTFFLFLGEHSTVIMFTHLFNQDM